MILVHGFGCDQHMWRFVTPAFLDEFTIIRYDLTGSGRSDLSAQDRYTQHSALDVMGAFGLCPHLSAPDATIAAKRKYLTATQQTLATQ